MSSPKSKALRSLDILKNIKANKIKAESLSPDERRPLVALLVAEGRSTAEIAHLLNTSDRTVERDKKAIRENNALSQDPELAGIMAGRLVDEASICVQRIRKFQREPNCRPAAKIDGERACFQITNDLTERLQSLGFLPTAPRKLEADLNHHSDDSLTLNEIATETQRLRGIKSSLPTRKVKRIKSTTLKEKDDG